MNRCCPQSHLQQSHLQQKSIPQKNLTQYKPAELSRSVPNRFLSASYFIAMLTTLGFYPSLLHTARSSGDSTVLLSSGCLGFVALIFTVVSFLYYSEADTVLKKWFAGMRNLVLSISPVLFWWAFYLKTQHSWGTTTHSFEWAVALGLCSSLLLLFMSFVVKLSQKQLLTSYLFLSAALSIYSAILINTAAWQSVSVLLLLSGLLSLFGFVLQTQSEFSKKCQNVEVFLLLSVMLQFGTVLLM